jgi:hypothetical protein
MDQIDEFERLELRACPCGSHLAVVLEVFKEDPLVEKTCPHCKEGPRT